MKTKFALLVLITLISAASALFADEWLVFSRFGALEETKAIYITKIDSLGNIQKGPVPVITTCNSCAASITDGDPGQFVLMVIKFDSTFTGIIERSILDKSTLTASKPQRIGLYQFLAALPDSLQITQNASHRFLVIETKEESARGFGLTSQGLLDGTKWRANPRVSGLNIFQVGVAPDGGLSWAVNINQSKPSNKVYLQPLASSGLPSGTPSVGATANGEFVDGVDISNPLPGSVRYLAYHNTIDFSTGTLNLNVVNAVTGKRLSQQLIDPDAVSLFVQNIAVDPQGRFLIYSKRGACTSHIPFGGHQLFFQALGANGTPSGAPKELLPCNSETDDAFLDIILD